MRPVAALLLVATWFGVVTQAGAATRCVLPVPDGGVVSSPANLRGRITDIALPLVRIRAEGTPKVRAVRLPASLVIYSAFGGDTTQSELQVGQHASVWYQGCKAGSSEVPQVAYFQIYSLDPADQPSRKPGSSKPR